MRLANSRAFLYAALAASRLLGKISERLAGVPTYVLWFVPWRVPVSERGLKKQRGWLELTQPFTLRTSVGRVAGFTAGAGPIVILVHGLGERAAALGGFITPLTEAGFRVVGVDLPGHGDSSGQFTSPIISAAAVRELAEHLGGADALIAHSLGGHAALWAMNEGLDVRAAVLIAPNVDMEYATDFFQKIFGLPDKAMTGLMRRIERRYGPTIWDDLDGERLVTRNQVSGLVIHDPDDDQVPFEGSQRLVRAWRASRLMEAPGLGHGAITRDPSVIESAVAFVSAPAREPADVRTEATTRKERE